MFNDAVILVADNIRDDVCLLRYALREAGIQNRIETVSDGAEAIDYLSGKGRYVDRDRYPAPDLLLLDLRLPRVDGLEVLRWRQDHDELRGLPVIVLSGPDNRQTINRALHLGAAGYYEKPLRFRDLVHLIRTELARVLDGMAIAA